MKRARIDLTEKCGMQEERPDHSDGFVKSGLRWKVVKHVFN